MGNFAWELLSQPARRGPRPQGAILPGNVSTRTAPDPGQICRVGSRYLTNCRQGGIRQTQSGPGRPHTGPDETQRFPSRLCRAEKTNCGTSIEPLILTRLPATGNGERLTLAAPSCRPKNIRTKVAWCRLIRKTVYSTARTAPGPRKRDAFRSPPRPLP